MENVETILLDNRIFNSFTREWDVPILRLSNISADELIIDGRNIPSNDFSINGNKIALSSKIKIRIDSIVYLKIKFSDTTDKKKEESFIIKFWLPIILLLLNILQPILHELNIIYVPSRKYEIYQSNLDYDTKKNKLITRVQLVEPSNKNKINESEINDWKLYIAMKEDISRENISHQVFSYISSPINLKDLSQKVEIVTDSPFTQTVVKNGNKVINVLFLIKNGTEIPKPFNPNYIKDGNVRQIGYGAILPNDKYESSE